MTRKKEKMKGIEIPEKCGRADKYEITAILYHDENEEALMRECKIFITEEDYKDNKPFITVSGNMNPTLLLFPDEYNIGIGCLTYDLVEAELVHCYDEGACAVVVSKVVNASDTVWKDSEVDRAVYLEIKPKIVTVDDGVINVGETGETNE